MRIVHESSRNRTAWLNRRSKYVTASEVASIMGLNRYQSRDELMNTKLNNVQVPMNTHMQRGIDFEKQILTIGCHTYGIRAWRQWDRLVSNTTYPWLAATPDGFACVDGEIAVLEAKAPSKRLTTDEALGRYLCQLVTQMAVCGAGYAILMQGLSPDYTAVKREHVFLSEHQDLLSNILNETEAFWMEYATYAGIDL